MAAPPTFGGGRCRPAETRVRSVADGLLVASAHGHEPRPGIERRGGRDHDRRRIDPRRPGEAALRRDGRRGGRRATAAKAASVCNTMGCPATGWYCFGWAVPARAPLPAQGIKA